jgi:hypothetical protein
MMTTREDPTKRDLPSAASATDAAAKGEPAKKLDPWHFGAHTVPPNLRAELSNIELPDAPAERRYRPQAPAADGAEPTEELSVPKRDFRRSVIVGLGALILVVSLGAAVRCATAPDDAAPPSGTQQPVVKQPETEAPAITPAASAHQVAAQPSTVEPPTKPAPTTSGSASKPAIVKPKPAAIASQPGSGLQQDRVAAPAPPASSTSSGRIVPAED